MKSILAILFEKSIELGDETFSDDQIKSKWIGNPSATIEEIEATEIRLGIELPSDYKKMLMVSNGFPTSTNAVSPPFVSSQMASDNVCGDTNIGKGKQRTCNYIRNIIN